MSAASGPYLGPETGEMLGPADLADLERRALEYSAGAVTQAFPVVTEHGTPPWRPAEIPSERTLGEERGLREGDSRGRRGGGLGAVPGSGLAARGSGAVDRAAGGRGAALLPSPPDSVRGVHIPAASLRSSWTPAFVLILTLVGIGWSVRHILSTEQVIEGHPSQLSFLWSFVFISLVWHIGLAWTERPFKTSARQQKYVDSLELWVNIPTYNEQPQIVRTVFTAAFRQERMPQHIHVVDDGTSTYDYAAIGLVGEFYALAREHPEVDARWITKPNGGKRSAQMISFRMVPRSVPGREHIIATLDSDSVKEYRANAEGLKPFARKDVMSVAAVILAYNCKASILTRLTDPWLMAFQLCVRSALSRLGSVLVNSGNLSYYRGDAILNALDCYENELFMNREVQFSDDSLLTLLAYLQGKTVQQSSSFAFTVLPENIRHHVNQQLRWMRGSTIRSIWRFRYLPVFSFAYWEHFASWWNFAMVSVAFGDLFIYGPAVQHKEIPVLFQFSALVAYATALKYLTIRRSDQSFWYQLGTFLLSPVMLIWTALILRPLRVYAMATCWKTGWGTRGDVEVEI